MIHFRFQTMGAYGPGGRTKAADLNKKYKHRRDVLRQKRYDMIKEQGERLLQLAKEEAPKDTGDFAAGLKGTLGGLPGTGDNDYSIRVSGVRASGLYNATLLDYILRGTRAHVIPTGGSPAQIAKGYPLGFYWKKGPRGPGKYHFWSVNHPGTKPNKFPSRAVDRWLPDAADALEALGIEVWEA